MAVLIAPFCIDDPVFYQIECAAHGAPWSNPAFLSCSGRGYRLRGLWLDGVAQGFSICREVAGELTLMNVAVHPSQQGKGLGALLLRDIIDYVSDEKAEIKASVFLEVREGNAAAIALYRKAGFRDIGRRPAYYPPIPPANLKETAVVMRLG
ncbi:ribosomal-protein-alanine N-acetyltransferase [Aliidiomarina minuta]|uniref:Ribosomal-protein-alanine N-acetyltransferase n=1 Tax=Aliidiomarina minuta TaxID=880057 RepID=A0A432W808_9GAMM|nr:GNAT family N-acetyltransferase [Aliidiomarina minuta]RUO26240.1 ribosomal-protein-alanine N-acetyltransferase [Aliidiomarina minuta]